MNAEPSAALLATSDGRLSVSTMYKFPNQFDLRDKCRSRNLDALAEIINDPDISKVIISARWETIMFSLLIHATFFVTQKSAMDQSTE